MPPVYRDYDQAALDLQYNNMAHVADPAGYVRWYAEASARVRRKVRRAADIAYGALPDQRLDVFVPEDAGRSDEKRPVVVYVHGGAWKALSKDESSFPAETVTGRGALFVPLGFSILPLAGNLDEMVAQVRAGVAWVRESIGAYGGDPDRIYIVGHSSGAHLAAMAMVTDWPRMYALPSDTIKAGAVFSGMYDLEPVRLSYRNEMLDLDRAAEIRNSPARNLPAGGPRLFVGCAEYETDEFKRQAESFARHWTRRGNDAEFEIFPGLNHYEIIETFTDSGSRLSRRIFQVFSI